MPIIEGAPGSAAVAEFILLGGRWEDGREWLRAGVLPMGTRLALRDDDGRRRGGAPGAEAVREEEDDDEPSRLIGRAEARRSYDEDAELEEGGGPRSK
jgi:hypothetical protein